MRFIFLLFIGLFFMSVAVDARANDKKREMDLLNVQYSNVNYESVTNLALKLGDFDFSNDALIDEYIAITNCPLYTAYFQNDFLWQRVRNGVRRQLSYYAFQFTDRYEIISSIDMGRYDFGQSAFILPEDSKLENVSYFSLARLGSLGEICGRKIVILPHLYTSVLNRPVNIQEIPMDASTAKSVIEKSLNGKNPDKRMGVLRMRMKFLGVEEGIKDNQLYSEIKYKTEIDDITVFENSRMDKILWQKTFKDLDR